MDNSPAKLKQNGTGVNSRFASVFESDFLENHRTLQSQKTQSVERFVIGLVAVRVFLSAVWWQHYQSLRTVEFAFARNSAAHQLGNNKSRNFITIFFYGISFVCTKTIILLNLGGF